MTTRPTRTHLAQWKRAADEATPGPWTVQYENEGDYEQGIPDENYPYALIGPKSVTVWKDPQWGAEYGHQVSEIADMQPADADFIAASRTAVPALITEVEALRAERDAALARIQKVRGVLDYHRNGSWNPFHTIEQALRWALDGGDGGM